MGTVPKSSDFNNYIRVSTSKSMVKCKINVDTDFTDYTDFHNHYQSVKSVYSVSQNSEHYAITI